MIIKRFVICLFTCFLGGIYDFETNKPDEIGQKIQHLEGVREKLSRNINTRSISLLDKEEEQYNDTLKKKKIVENDKIKILETIKHLDEKKKQILVKAWEQVYNFSLQFKIIHVYIRVANSSRDIKSVSI